MVKILVGWVMMAGCLMPTIAGAAFWDKTEEVKLDLKPSAPREINDEAYQKITIKTAGIEGFCKDSYVNSFARNLIGKNNRALLVLTMDKVPIMKLEYDDKTKQCTKATWQERDFSGFELSRNANKEHQLNLIYSSRDDIKSLEKFVEMGAQLPNVTGQLLARPIAAGVAPFLDAAFASAASSADDHSIIFQMPSNDKFTQETLWGYIGQSKHQLFHFYLTVNDDLFSSKGFASIMTQPLDSGVRPQEALEIRRAKEKLPSHPGDLVLIKNECAYLKSTYQSRLNEADMQRLLEAYLLNNHRGALTAASIEGCFGYAVNEPMEALSFKVLADEVLDIPNNKKDTHFLNYLYDGQAKKVLQEGATFYDKDGQLGVSDMESYLKSAGSTSALCHTYVAFNQAAYIQIINSRVYYVRASVDREYTKQEAATGSLSKVGHISLSRNFDKDYEDIRGVKQCINEQRQKYGLANL